MLFSRVSREMRDDPTVRGKTINHQETDETTPVEVEAISQVWKPVQEQRLVSGRQRRLVFRLRPSIRGSRSEQRASYRVSE